MEILIVSHDSGAAEIISAWVRRNPQNKYSYILEGPAVKIFNRKIESIKNHVIEKLTQLLLGHDFVLTGTSWESDIEKKAIFIAKKKGKKSITFLDHWVNYPERFQFEGQQILPDEIWVGDEDALSLAKDTFHSQFIYLVPNPYFMDIREKISSMVFDVRSDNKLKILFIGEPISEHALKEQNDNRYFGYTELEALDNYLRHCRDTICSRKMVEISIRQHPAEQKDKYKSITDKYRDMSIVNSEKLTLLEDCCWTDWVVGCESMGLVIGLIAGRKVFSIIPKGGKDCGLPQKDIIHLFN